MKNNDSTVIGLGGYATSGKDTVADFLVSDHGFVKTYMSKYLEQALLLLKPLVYIEDNIWNSPALHNDEFIRYSVLHRAVGYNESKMLPEVRRLLQVLGTEIGRNMFGDNYWINLIKNEILQAFSENKSVVVSGIRYPNELFMIRDYLGGQVWWIERPGVDPVNTHSSDNSLDKDNFQHVLLNNGTLEDLRNTANIALSCPVCVGQKSR